MCDLLTAGWQCAAATAALDIDGWTKDHRFYYEVIELAKLSTVQLRAFGEVGLLPLVPLTKDGASRDKVEALVQKRFPTMLRLTRQLTKGIEHTSTFQTLLLQISTASTPEEVHQYLLTVGEEEDDE